MTDKFLVLALLVIFIPLSAHVQAQNYDLVISNGRVMDPETNFDSVANVGIKDLQEYAELMRCQRRRQAGSSSGGSPQKVD